MSSAVGCSARSDRTPALCRSSFSCGRAHNGAGAANRRSRRDDLRPVFDIEVRDARKLGHEALDPPSLNRALDALEKPSALDAGELARCNARLQRELASKLADAETAIARAVAGAARGPR